jgi:hypothetical protein
MVRTMEMLRHAGVYGVLAASLMIAGSASAGPPPPPPGGVHPTLYHGRATVVDAKLKLLTSNSRLVVSDTGFLDSAGGTKEETVLTIVNPPPLDVRSQTARAITSGADNVSSSNAVVERLSVKIPGLTVSAEVLEANTWAKCSPETQTVKTRAGSQIIGLMINDNAIPANPPPNTKIEIPGVATVILNQRRKLDANTVSANAVHIIVHDVADAGLLKSDIVIAHAESGITSCGQAVEPEPDPK